MRILVVDDDPLAGEMTGALLEFQGHDVLLANDAMEATSQLDAHDDIAMIVSDMHMPLINGIELLHMLREQGVMLPFILLTGRGSAAQWHTQTRTAKSAVLRKLYPETVYVEINPADARGRGIQSHDRVQVESRRGQIEATALVTHAVQPGHLFVPMHYAVTNQLTDAVFDPYSKQPSYKACAVNVRSA